MLTTQGLMAREVMLPRIFTDQRFEKVLAHAQIADQLGMVLGPLLAGLALEVWPWDGVVAATAALFLLADQALVLWRRRSTVQLAVPQAGAPVHWLQPSRPRWRMSGGLLAQAQDIDGIGATTLSSPKPVRLWHARHAVAPTLCASWHRRTQGVCVDSFR